MPFQNKMLENGREIIFRENKTTNKEWLFVNDKVLKERDKLCIILDFVNKQVMYRVCI